MIFNPRVQGKECNTLSILPLEYIKTQVACVCVSVSVSVSVTLCKGCNTPESINSRVYQNTKYINSQVYLNCVDVKNTGAQDRP